MFVYAIANVAGRLVGPSFLVEKGTIPWKKFMLLTDVLAPNIYRGHW
jgi:hypothetical protein